MFVCDFSSLCLSALAPLSSFSHFPASPMLFEDDGSIGHVPLAKKGKAIRCTNMSISKSFTMQLDSADIRKTQLFFSGPPKGSNLPHRYHHPWYWCRHLSPCMLWFTPFCITPDGKESLVVPRAGLWYQPSQSIGTIADK